MLGKLKSPYFFRIEPTADRHRVSFFQPRARLVEIKRWFRERGYQPRRVDRSSDTQGWYVKARDADALLAKLTFGGA